MLRTGLEDPSGPMTSGAPGAPAPRVGAALFRWGGPFEQVADFRVAGRREVLVPMAHRMERLRSPGTDELVDFGAGRGAGLGGGHRHGHDDAGGPGAAEDDQGRPQAGAGGHPVIDQDHDPAPHRRRPPVAPIGAPPARPIVRETEPGLPTRRGMIRERRTTRDWAGETDVGPRPE